MLDDNFNIMLPGQWIGLYRDFKANHAFVMQCSTIFIPYCKHQYRFSASLLPKFFTVGTHSWCLIEWECPTRGMIEFLHEIKIIYTTRGQQIYEISFSYGKTTTPSWVPMRWRRGGIFLTIPQSSVKTWSSTGLEGPLGQWTKRQGYLLGNQWFYKTQVWNPL